jgi:hypothetical protein
MAVSLKIEKIKNHRSIFEEEEEEEEEEEKKKEKNQDL